jgi:hypothetical protein
VCQECSQELRCFFLNAADLKRSGNLTVRHGSSVEGCENSYCCDIVRSGMREANVVGDEGNVFCPRDHYVQTRLYDVIT